MADWKKKLKKAGRYLGQKAKEGARYTGRKVSEGAKYSYRAAKAYSEEQKRLRAKAAGGVAPKTKFKSPEERGRYLARKQFMKAQLRKKLARQRGEAMPKMQRGGWGRGEQFTPFGVPPKEQFKHPWGAPPAQKGSDRRKKKHGPRTIFDI